MGVALELSNTHIHQSNCLEYCSYVFSIQKRVSLAKFVYIHKCVWHGEGGHGIVNGVLLKNLCNVKAWLGTAGVEIYLRSFGT